MRSTVVLSIIAFGAAFAVALVWMMQQSGIAVPTTQPGANSPAGASSGQAGTQSAQKRCPVTEEELGSMGKPISVSVKGQTIYVCCRSCVAKVQGDPDKYLAKVATERTTDP